MSLEDKQLEEHLAALRSQTRAAMRVLRTTNQMLAQAEDLFEQARTAKEAQRNDQHRDRTPLRVA